MSQSLAIDVCRDSCASPPPTCNIAPVMKYIWQQPVLHQLSRRGSGRAGSRGFLASLALPATATAVAAVGSVVLLVVLLVANSMPVARGQAYLPANMIDAMESAMFLNKFMDAADVTGFYDKFLNENFRGTVFAPVDLGFDALLQKTNATWDDLLAPELNSTLAAIVGLHVVPAQRVFPLSSVREGTELTTAAGMKLYVRRDVPGITHIYAVPRPEEDPLNFATVLQYQEIRGGKAILYVVDKVLLPPVKASPPAPAPTTTRRNRGAPANTSSQRKARV
ncbi:hypothetical protein VOLCADRAFT_88686 [Volvox carteri f. nagariensis]|uniref:FAS1 domain-containing protein n=1 Tax=Volvox carteri f. nagariensis TaxID=3068 RepID=D8TPP1_VOLCA|nr:uncharacterized protein VOLCADRAFT_88686 [Volvox carteri f. nagariensis]EFJ50799.1 hypothetical protein VOLCADRAFT_88686 [Volvox carteri f. nagariensis]|eukprot:XP_002948392.1 hypothetical protein VOLCADRAFT_88686 [Volvox carteri f. nagariensis]